MNANTISMKNPFTNRINTFTVLETTTDEALAALREGGIKALSWKLLDQGGVSGRNVFENALDWGVGLIVVGRIEALAKIGKKAKRIRVAVAGNGTLMIINSRDEMIMARR